MVDSRDLHVIALGPETAALWFALDPPSEAIAPALEHMRQVLAGGPLNPCMLAVVLMDDQPVARFQAVLDEAGRLGVWAPQFRDGLEPAAQGRCADAFLRQCLAHADRRTGMLYAETELPEAALPAWRAALERHGFARVGSYRLYDRPLSEAPMAPEAPAITWRPVDALADAEVAALLAAIRGESHDQIHRLAPERAEVQLHRLKTIPLLEPDHSRWRIAFLEGSPAGLIFSSLESEAYGTPGQGWIVEIGVAPAFRQRGLSKILLRRGLKDLHERGARAVRARIDEGNIPSIRLHGGAGFQPSSDRWDVLWRPRPTGLRHRLGALWRTFGRPQS